MKISLRFILISLLVIFSSGCAYISEIGLLHKANMSDSEFEIPLKINVQPNLISNHMMVKRDGTLWSMDVNFQKRKYYLPKETYLGRNSTDFFGKVEFIDNVKEVAANKGVIIVLKNDGTLWSWGRLEFGPGSLKNIGLLGYDEVEVNKPQKIPGMPPIRSVVMSDIGVTAIDMNGSVWKWGRRHFQINPDKYGLVPEVNAVAYNLPLSEYLNTNFNKPQKIQHLTSISKISKRYNVYLTETGDVLKLIAPRFVQKMLPYIDSKVGLHLYKMKLPSKAVDVVNNTVLLDNGHVYELAILDGIFTRNNYGETVSPTRRLTGLSQVTMIADKLAVTDEGSLYRWGRVYYFGVTSELMQRYYPAKPVHVGFKPENIHFFSRDLFISHDNSIYLYRNQSLLFGLDKRHWPPESKPFFYENYFTSPIARRKSVKNATTYFKLIGISG
jgi:alpha-tubulin suppressor-like RCC1 family protein